VIDFIGVSSRVGSDPQHACLSPMHQEVMRTS
jgi:hypothetical protein